MKQPISLPLQKLPNNYHNFFGSYVAQICPNISFASSKIFLQYSFFYYALNGILWRKCHVSYLFYSQTFWAFFYVQIMAHAKSQLHLPSQTSSVIFQSFCQTEAIVKEVLARSIQINWNFACLFTCSYHSPPNFSPSPWSMWEQDQIFASVYIFTFWSKYILYCFILAEHLPENSHDHNEGNMP